MTDPQPAGSPSRPRLPKQEQEAASEEIVEVVPGVLRMQLPIAMPGLGHVNMYGLLDRRGLAVVDPGLPGPSSWKTAKARLKAAGFRLRDVHTVVVTHSHIDHFGNAGRIAKEAGAELVTHRAFSTFTVKGPNHARVLSESEAQRAEAAAAALAQASDISSDELPTIEEAAPGDPEVVHDDTDVEEVTSVPWGKPTPWGTKHPGPSRRQRLLFRVMRLFFTSPEPTRRVHHGDHLHLAEREWVALHTPGHTVDHLCLFDPETGALLCGDHVLPTITPHISGVVRADALKSYLATLDLVAGIPGVKVGLPAHGHPFHDVPGRVEAIKAHHEERMELLRRASLSLGPAGIDDLSHEVFPRKYWGIMAEAETFAHLEHLVHAGEAERWEEGGRLLYRAAPR